MKPRLYIFAKAPVIGGAKTRLAAGIGKVPAWRHHRAMSARIIRKVQSPLWITVLTVSPDRACARSFPNVWPKHLRKIAQGAGDLGARQARIFARSHGLACVIGTDTPAVRASDIARAFKALRGKDAVIGPAEDGGYWLLALQTPIPHGVFDDIRWSHDQTRADLIARLNASGYTKIAQLRCLRDIDYSEDLKP